MFGRGAEKFKEKTRGPIVDLDALISEEQCVKFQGITHTIKPIEVREFYALANAWAHVQDLAKRPKVSVDDLVEAYHCVISSVAPTITKEMIRSATPAQMSALVQIVLDQQNGRPLDEKKKTLIPAPEASILRS